VASDAEDVASRAASASNPNTEKQRAARRVVERSILEFFSTGAQSRDFGPRVLDGRLVAAREILREIARGPEHVLLVTA